MCLQTNSQRELRRCVMGTKMLKTLIIPDNAIENMDEYMNIDKDECTAGETFHSALWRKPRLWQMKEAWIFERPSYQEMPYVNENGAAHWRDWS